MSVVKNNGPIIDPALCRCCRAIKKCRILTAEYTWMGKKEIYADMVMDCYGILLSHVDEVERDSGVCATCVVRLREAVAFRHQVLQCEELFLRAKLEPPQEDEPDENKLKKFDLELKTEPKDYSSDHNSIDDRDDVCPTYSDDDADDDKPLKKEQPKPVEPSPKDDGRKSEGSDFNGDSSSDSDEPIKKKLKRKAKAKANGAKKKPGKAAKKQKAESDTTETNAPTESKRSTEYEIPIELQLHTEIKTETMENELKEISNSEEITSNNYAETVKKKRIWVRRTENEISEYQLLCQELESNEELYFTHYNMSKDSYEELYKILESSIEKEYTNYRKPVPSRERLAVCLRYLKTADSFNIIASFHCLGRTTISNIVSQVTKAIWDVLQPIYLPSPTAETWVQSEVAFKEIFDFPNCIGSIGGKHVLVKSLGIRGTQTDFHVQANQSSIVFVAVADAYCNLIIVDIDSYGTQSDNDFLEFTSFYRDYIEGKRILPPKPLPGNSKPISHVFLGDEGFAMKPSVMRPFPKSTAPKDPMQRVYNERLHEARTVDKVFGMFMAEWRIFHRPMECRQESAVYVIKAVCCLHNYVRSKHGVPNNVDKFVQNRSKLRRKTLNALFPFIPLKQRACNAAMFTRQAFMTYFNRSASAVNDVVTSHPVQNIQPDTADEITIKEEPITK